MHTTTNYSFKKWLLLHRNCAKTKIVTPSREGNIYNSLYILQHCFLPDCFPCVLQRSCLTPTQHQACIRGVGHPSQFFYVLYFNSLRFLEALLFFIFPRIKFSHSFAFAFPRASWEDFTATPSHIVGMDGVGYSFSFPRSLGYRYLLFFFVI